MHIKAFYYNIYSISAWNVNTKFSGAISAWNVNIKLLGANLGDLKFFQSVIGHHVFPFGVISLMGNSLCLQQCIY